MLLHHFTGVTLNVMFWLSLSHLQVHFTLFIFAFATLLFYMCWYIGSKIRKTPCTHQNLIEDLYTFVCVVCSYSTGMEYNCTCHCPVTACPQVFFFYFCILGIRFIWVLGTCISQVSRMFEYSYVCKYLHIKTLFCLWWEFHWSANYVFRDSCVFYCPPMT